MISWLTCAIIRERIVVKVMLSAMTPTNSSAIRPIPAVSPAGTATSSNHRVIRGIKSVVARAAESCIERRAKM